ncbi:S1 family peptidase [Streptomyces sp. TRM 70351]|uniref:S1 family peptidase n=1 Tax=Streptomyces sp. TRM 70351 TaxID=3116552 RepID=UPI002E7B9561|nr:S1 family peptidase [Streptomyces sp. TRM 70351]MEE1930114.1 S1 family peptidase [Streptomyces sp. TRM 70351]
MRRKHGVRTGLSALLVLGVWAGAVTGSPAASAAPAPAPELVQALQRDLGLTASEAKERLRQEARATALEPRAAEAAGDGFAGSWFDPDSGALVVAATDTGSAEAAGKLGVRTTVVEHSARELDAAKARIDALVRTDPAPAGVSGWHVDPRANTVVVDVVSGQRNEPDVRAFVAQAREAGPVRVRADRTQAPQTFAAGTVGGDPYYTGNVRCSIGFSVHGGFVTAGHCGRTGSEVRGWDRSVIGHFQGSSFPGNDYAWVSVGHGWWTVPVVLGWGAVPDRLVRGSAEAPVGASICRSGSTTRWHCGTVLAKNETVNYSQGAVHQMTKTSVCAEGGDSGGAFISGDQAQGVTSGGWGNCSSGGETWFQPLNEILSAYGLTLHTA